MGQEINPKERQRHSDTNFSDQYRQRVISRIQGYFISRGATRGNNLKGNPDEIEELLSNLISDFSITIKGENPPYEIKRLSTNETIINVNGLSSGEAELITVGIDILIMSATWDIKNQENRLILIDEPDAHIHPDLQVRLADFICSVVDKFNIQIVVATHSTTSLSALGQHGKEKTSVIYLRKNNQEFKAQKFSKSLEEISACLGGHLLMGPLFGAPLILVEGDDDYRIWSQVPRHSNVNIAVMPSNGTEIYDNQKILEKVFGSLCEKKVLGYALLDGDKSLPQPSTQKSQDYIKFIQLSCHEAENLYLTDEVLSNMGKTWEGAKEILKNESVNYGNKKEDIDNLTNADRKTTDLKQIINEVSKILDNKNVHWTTRVGITLGREKPTGQLAEFLGEQVINAIWKQEENESEEFVLSNVKETQQ